MDVLFVCFVAEKDAPRKALRPNGFEVLCDLYFCFSSLFLGHFRTPHIDILTNPYANRCKKRAVHQQPFVLLQSYNLLI